MDIKNKTLEKIDNEIIDYIWNFKTHYINKETLYRPKLMGGLALPNPTLVKRKNILNRIKSLDCTPDIPWKALYIFWIGFGMRNIQEIYNNNKLVKRIDTIAPYKEIKDTLYKYRDNKQTMGT